MLTLSVTEGRIAEPNERSRVLYPKATIGRDEDNDWVLPDPHRYLSGRHCVITYREGEYWITDTSLNGVFINGASSPLGRGSSLPLHDGDRFKIGDYEISAKVAPDLDQPVDVPRQPGAGRGAAGGRADEDSFAAVLRADAPLVNENDPFGLGHGPAQAPPREAGVPPLSAPPAVVEPARSPSPNRVTSFDQIDSPASLDDDGLFASAQPGSASWGRDPSDPGFAASPASISSDPIGRGFAVRPPGAHPDHVSPLNQALLLPQPRWNDPPEYRRDEEGKQAAPLVQREAAAAAPAQLPNAEEPDAGASCAAIAAFLEAAGIEIGNLSVVDDVELMRNVGACFREMTEGLRQILSARATVKNELRLDRTIAGATNNNPLKFATGTEEVLMTMLRPPSHGYMPSLDALRQAYSDVQAHEIAMMAGMQRALRALLQRFDPAHLQQRLDQHPTLASILPGARHSRYWTAYERLYHEVASDAEDSFAGVYGREFARAYEEQVKKLK
jgi:type VI secretion system protein